MSISILKNEELNRFEIYSDGELAGFADFKVSNQMISYTHTEIDPRFGGQGLGSQLIKEALDEALEQNLEVAPHCSFVSAYIKKSGEKYLHLVPESKRVKFDL
ncbi:MAG: N-acetyltransferase [Candidatus Nanopelagicales bacterium]|jgi:predicted GNAT family acetyltransferase|nr:N-acetyltransferase [Candidatus Nanopelagicales bacterium]MDP4864596.1 N-acetyltransferase [Candidatus Nanopelagicaceae bacterium]